jgi:hypothetical protein
MQILRHWNNFGGFCFGLGITQELRDPNQMVLARGLPHPPGGIRDFRATHPKTSATSLFFLRALHLRIPVRRSSPKILRRAWTHVARQVAGEDCSELASLRHAAPLRPALAGTLRSPKSRLDQRAARQLPRWAGPAHNPPGRAEACLSWSLAPALNEEWKLFSGQKRSSVPWANHP